MDNLPIGSSISGSEVYHEGNHDHRKNPHDQYVSKKDWHTTLMNDTDTSLAFKLFEIRFIRNSQYNIHYHVDLKIRNATTIFGLDITLDSSGVSKFKYERNTSFSLIPIYEELGVVDHPTNPSGKLTVYATFFNTYRLMNFRLNSAFLEQANGYSLDNQLAFDFFTSFDREKATSRSSLASNVTATTTREAIFGSATFEAADIAVNASRELKLSGTFPTNAVLTYSMTNIGGGLIPTPIFSRDDGSVSLYVNNVRNQSLRMPQTTVYYAVFLPEV